MISITTTLALFTMFGLSSFAVFWAKKVRIPHTVFLVVIGVILGFLSRISTFSFFTEFRLTPALIFYLLLPTLIFESAFNMSARKIVVDAVPIMLLAILSLLISTSVISGLLYTFLMLIGVKIPFIITLLFGALISATDPVAVLALFKEYGAPRRLSLIFEGESLFNDATAVALFLIILDVATNGFEGAATLLGGILNFLFMLLGGILFGGFMGGLFTHLVGLTRKSQFASITLTIVLAHITFILGELISHNVAIGSFNFHISSIIATTIASIIMGNYGRAKIHPEAEAFVGKLWEQLAFMANSIIFILIGILFVQVPFNNMSLALVVVCTILIVAFARAVSVYPVIGIFNVSTTINRRIPTAWQHLLSWGSLRGALAVTMVLLIPETFSVTGWNVASLSPREFLLALTVGCIFATLFLKATTMKKMMYRLKLDTLNEVEAVEYEEAQALMHHNVVRELRKYRSREYIDGDIADALRRKHAQAFEIACSHITELSTKSRGELASRIMRMYAIGIEKRHLKVLYRNDEINELVFRRIWGKLTLQYEEVEQGNLKPDMSLHTDGKDIFEHIAGFLSNLFKPLSEADKIKNTYLYHRAQTIISRKVLREINSLEKGFAASIFTDEAVQHVTGLYRQFRQQSDNRMREIGAAHQDIITPLTFKLAQFGVKAIEYGVLEDAYEKELITRKLHIALTEEIESTTGQV